MGIAPRDATDPDRTGSSLRNLADVVLACLDAAGAASVVEIGSSHGDFTEVLLGWAKGAGARVAAVEPAPPAELEALAAGHPELDLVRAASTEALAGRDRADAVIVDGDHNHHTVSEELRLIWKGSPGAELPLVLLHDVGWPHGRRDRYYEPERIPAEARLPLVDEGHLDPAEPGIAEGGLWYQFVAEREGGPGNGVLTAVEDFVAERAGLALAIVPPFFGLGVLWHREAPFAEAVARLVAPWDRNPLLERLEADRVFQLVRWARTQQARERTEHRLRIELAREREQRAREEVVLRTLMDSRAFAVGERLSRLRQRGDPRFSREEVRRLLDQAPGEGGEGEGGAEG